MKKILSKITAIAAISSTLFHIPCAYASGKAPKSSLPTLLSQTQSDIDCLLTLVKKFGDSIEKELLKKAVDPAQPPIIIRDMSTGFDKCEASLIEKEWSVFSQSGEPHTFEDWQNQGRAYDQTVRNFSSYLLRRNLYGRKSTPENFKKIKEFFKDHCEALIKLNPDYQYNAILEILTKYSTDQPSPLFVDFKDYLKKINRKRPDKFCIMHNSNYSRVCILIEFEGQLTLLAY